MDHIIAKNKEKAQGMVEFALVLPILLLIVLGIFAFGHMFFAYTTVVSASREAARYGSVVGAGGGGTLRYQDCDGIRGSAARIGTFVGVAPVATTGGYNASDPGIYIGYDSGPDDATVNATCPVGGPGPSDIKLGDRILVRVSINYKPIVPIVNLPSFTLSATSARTIVKDVPVGHAPPAAAVEDCMGTKIEWDPASVFDTVVVGQVVTPRVKVTVDDATTPVGDVTITAFDPEVEPVEFLSSLNNCEDISVPGKNFFDTGCAITFEDPLPEDHPGYGIEAAFTPADPNTQCPSVTASYFVAASPADTIVSFDPLLPIDPPTFEEDRTLWVKFKLKASPPGAFLSKVGSVQVKAVSQDGTSTFTCSVDMSTMSGPVSGEYAGTCNLGATNSLLRDKIYYTVTAAYTGGGPNYNDSPIASLPPYVVFPEPVITTATEILTPSDGSTSFIGNNMLVNVEVKPAASDNGAPVGSVVVTAYRGGNSYRTCTINKANLTDPDHDGDVVGSCSFTIADPDTYTIKAEFIPDDFTKFTGSSDTVLHTVKTNIPTEICPAVGDLVFSTRSLDFVVSNNASGSKNRTLESVELVWPVLPIAKWQEVRFGGNLDECKESNGNNANCIWKNVVNGQVVGIDPPQQTASSSANPRWIASGDSELLYANSSKTMRLVFSSLLEKGEYKVRLKFSDGCLLDFKAGTKIN